MDWITIFSNNGVPTIILGFILWFGAKPLFNAFIKNIEKQTEINQQMLDSCKEFKIMHMTIADNIADLKKDIEKLKA